MTSYSKLLRKNYQEEDCVHIPNMLQNYKYLNSEVANDDLMDIVCGSDNKLVFVWRKSPITNMLYDKWCKHEL